MLPTSKTTRPSQPRIISDIDRLMRRGNRQPPQSPESLLKAAITGMERTFRRPNQPSPALHVWTATGYRFFKDGSDGLAKPAKALPHVWNEVLPAVVADTRATRLAYGQVVFLPASLYREDPDGEYGCYFASVVALDGHGFFGQAGCPVVPTDRGFRRMADWRLTYPALDEYADALENPGRVIDALLQQEQPVSVAGLVEVATS